MLLVSILLYEAYIAEALGLHFSLISGGLLDHILDSCTENARDVFVAIHILKGLRNQVEGSRKGLANFSVY